MVFDFIRPRVLAIHAAYSAAAHLGQGPSDFAKGWVGCTIAFREKFRCEFDLAFEDSFSIDFPLVFTQGLRDSVFEFL
jgi:hypothetical protein